MPKDLKANEESLNETMLKFGAPATILHRYAHWLVLLRPAQATLGSLILAAYEKTTAFSELSRDAFTELAQVTHDIESVLKNQFAYDKLNYLMLMMVDKDVHFHVIPRYAGPQQFADVEFVDSGWPGPPDLAQNNDVDATVFGQLTDELKAAWLQQI